MIRVPVLRAAAVLLIVLAALASAVSPGVAAGPEPGRMDVRDDGRHARIVFSFDRRPRHQIVAQSGVLVIRFERPVDISVDALTRDLRNYVASARRDADGAAIRVALQRKVRVNTSEAGDQLFVDLLPEPWSGPAPALPPEVIAEMQRRAEEQERLRREEEARQRRRAVRSPIDLNVGEAPTFTRLEFRSRERVVATVSRGPREVRVAFERVGSLELGPIRARLPRFLDGIRTEDGDDRLIVVLDVDAVRDVRSFEDANAFVVDILGPERGAVEFRSDGSIGQSRPSHGDQTTIMRGVPRPEPGVPPASTGTGVPPPAPAPQPPPQRRAEAPVPLPPERPPERIARRAGDAPVVTAAAPAPSRAPASVVAAVDDVDDIVTGSVGRAENQTLLVVEPAVEGNAITIGFDFDAPTPAAVFQRGSSLWMIFTSNRRIDASRLARDFPQRFRGVATTQRDGYAVVRAEIDGPFLVTTEIDGERWNVTVGDTIRTPPRALTVAPRSLADGRSSVTVDLEAAVRVHRIPDPIVGDELLVATALGPITGLLRQQTFVDFLLLASAHGVALKSHADDLQVRRADAGLTIERDAGLQLSFSGARRAANLGPAQTNQARTGFIDFEGWKFGAPDMFIQIRDALVARAASTQGTARRDARLDLARFNLAHGLGAEANMVLTLARQEEPALEGDPLFRLLRGVAHVQSGRYELGERDITLPEFAELPDVAIWRGLVAEHARQYAVARRHLERGRTVLGSYPRAFQARVLLALARAALATNDIGTVQGIVEEARTLDSGPLHRAELQMLTARIAEVTGRHEEAVAGFQAVEQDGAPKLRASAKARRISLQLAMQRVTPDIAARELESLSFDWRGDELEPSLHLRLATIHFGRGNDRGGFLAARRTMMANPENVDSRLTHDMARDRFVALFADGEADDKPPLEALALFYDFRELVPVGRRGDQMIRALADRLLEVDLLDQAAELLTHQVDNRLEGAQRADVGAQLGFIHLLNRDPERALAAIRRTQIARLPGEIERRRRLIEARALAALGRPDIGIELLGEDDSEPTRRLRADLLWEGRSWAPAAAALEELSLRAATAGTLSELVRNDVLRAAVAYALAGDQRGLDRLRAAFSSRLADTPESHAFDVLTGPIAGQGGEYRAVARSVGAVDTLRNFLRDYRERFGGRERQRTASAGG